MQTATASRRPMNHCNVKNELHKLGGLLERHHYNERNELLDAMIDACGEGRETSSEKMLGHLMAVNLRKRFSGTGITENLYDTTDSVSQIRLFDILIHQFPFVKHGQEMTNNAILQLLSQHPQACIIDIGIGLGTQMLHIIEQAKQLPNLQKLTIVGIEPFENALNTAAEKILNCRDQVHFDLEFVAVPEYIEHADLSKHLYADTAIIVNASLALHHIKTDAERTKVIRDIHALRPKGFFLIEPNVNHFTNDLSTRILNCYEHFIGIFQVIDRLDASTEDKNSLKLFFGREMEDILSKANDEERFEKHELVTSWLHRLAQAGFRMDTSRLLTEPMEKLGVKIQPFPKGYVGFSEKEETILSVMFASY